ncbi:MAG: hypothetical protein AAF213_01845 [Pseudomonadota bacterium]
MSTTALPTPASPSPTSPITNLPSGHIPTAPQAIDENAPDPTVNNNAPPTGVPAKFWDPVKGEIRVDALLKSYLELERKLSETGRVRPANSVDDYAINVPGGLFDPDPDINQRLFGAGFSPEQAQLVYDMAAEYIIPLIREMASELQAERELERLVKHFGGEAKWREVSRQLMAWASKEMPSPVVEALASTEAGVMAMYQMMQNQGNGPINARSNTTATPGEAHDLDAMIRDPRYWRDKDPAFIKAVTNGFQQRYSG